MRTLTIAILALVLHSGAAMAKTDATASTLLGDDGKGNFTFGADGVGSLDVFKCENCGDSAYDRSRGKKTDPGTFVENITNPAKHFDADADTAI